MKSQEKTRRVRTRRSKPIILEGESEEKSSEGTAFSE